jgi:hypothetical protein
MERRRFDWNEVVLESDTTREKDNKGERGRRRESERATNCAKRRIVKSHHQR